MTVRFPDSNKRLILQSTQNEQLFWAMEIPEDTRAKRSQQIQVRELRHGIRSEHRILREEDRVGKRRWVWLR